MIIFLQETPGDGAKRMIVKSIKLEAFFLQTKIFLDRSLSFFFWPLCCLFFFDIRILITALVSSNSSLKRLHRKLKIEQHELR
jgi:hypothetical protein